MAENQGVWGIDIGQAGLKAVRLRYADAAEQAIAVAFDYVPHPKILSQPDAVPEELIPQALEKFLSRNDVKGDALAISVPGQTSLVKFIKLPPVESSKVAEIVKYEAKQQIPFALEDVIWDYQPLGGGTEESGFLLDAEVGLFAMKRDQVMQHLRPFTNAKLEVELIQTAPLALFNVLSYDYLGQRLGSNELDADSEDHYILVDMGADNTTLLVSNGVSIWIRNVPIGGNHFTRALTKEMKLTFAKAEHLKCNATKSPDPRAVFQALRPVFNDYVSEIQRSIGYFSSVNREAKIKKVLGMGNGFKLAGLQKFLQQNLQYEVERLENFNGLVGDSVLNAPLFVENIMSFGVSYGLALQGLNQTRIRTTLLPPEIATARKIRRKKPWAVTTAAVLLASLATSAAGYSHVWKTVETDRWQGAETAAADLTSQISSLKSAYEGAKTENQQIKDRGLSLLGNLDTREYWLEIYKAINECLPRDLGDDVDETDPRKQNRIKLWSITAEKQDDVSEWFDGLDPANRDAYMLARDRENPPSGPGYVFTLEGIHYHHEDDDPTMQGPLYVRETLLKNLQQWEVKHGQGTPFPVRKLGISHAVIASALEPVPIPFDPSERTNQRRWHMFGARRGLQSGMGEYGGGYEESYEESGGYEESYEEGPGYGAPQGGGYGRPGGYGGAGGYPGATPYPGTGAGPTRQGLPLRLPDGRPLAALAEEKELIYVPQTRFTVQFVWKPTPARERLESEPEPGATPDGMETAL